MPKKPKYKWELCKPCWELHYCPYGSLVEFYPLTGGEIDLEERKAHFKSILERANGGIGNEDEAWEFVNLVMYNDPMKWQDLKDLEDYDTTGMACNVFGHTCPVFFTAYGGVSETAKRRRPPSRYIPREVMLQVVRRDGQRCQKCGCNVPDNELHFDHLIPVSKGGPSTVANVRVLCRDCNLAKSDNVLELLAE